MITPTINTSEKRFLENYLKNTGIDYDIFPTPTGLKFLFTFSGGEYIMDISKEELNGYRTNGENYLLRMVGEARKVQRFAQRS